MVRSVKQVCFGRICLLCGCVEGDANLSGSLLEGGKSVVIKGRILLKWSRLSEK